jgi:putative heme-binding domain-containing protein
VTRIGASFRHVVALIGVVLAFAAPLDAQNPEHVEAYAAADIAAGSRLYTALCASCHGPTGIGVGGIDLRRGLLPRASTDAALMSVITTGFPASGMPPFKLNPNEIKALIAYIRTGFDSNASDGTVPQGDPARGRVVFEGTGNCLSCHRVHDKGAYTAPDLTEIGRTHTPVAIQRSLLDPTGSMRPINRPVRAVARDGTVITGHRLNEDSYTVQLVDDRGRLVSLVKADLREWTVSATSPMPSYKERLTQQALGDLVAYLVSLKGTQP